MSDLGARHLGEVVTTVPGSARVLESFGLDYCCGGGRSLAAACAEHGVDPDDVIRELHGLVGGAAHDWATLGPAQMVDHLQSTHHAYLHTELPRLDALAEKVASVHGARHPELMDVLAAVRELRDDLEPHLLKEERILFPLIRELVAEVTAGSVTTRSAVRCE
jgi:regulator of cell morphogenesis and NO signaling